MDSDKLKNVVHRIGDFAKTAAPWSEGSRSREDIIRPLLSLEEFFDGNDDASSIWCNLESEPEPQQVYAFLKSLRSRPDVSDVLIMVTQYDGPGTWPSSDRIYVITAASPEEVEAWIPEAFKPDETGTGFGDFPHEEVRLSEGMQPIWLWYD